LVQKLIRATKLSQDAGSWELGQNAAEDTNDKSWGVLMDATNTTTSNGGDGECSSSGGDGGHVTKCTVLPGDITIITLL
jgi:hypothetical protein